MRGRWATACLPRFTRFRGRGTSMATWLSKKMKKEIEDAFTASLKSDPSIDAKGQVLIDALKYAPPVTTVSGVQGTAHVLPDGFQMVSLSGGVGQPVMATATMTGDKFAETMGLPKGIAEVRLETTQLDATSFSGVKAFIPGPSTVMIRYDDTRGIEGRRALLQRIKQHYEMLFNGTVDLIDGKGVLISEWAAHTELMRMIAELTKDLPADPTTSYFAAEKTPVNQANKVKNHPPADPAREAEAEKARLAAEEQQRIEAAKTKHVRRPPRRGDQ